MMSNIPVNLGDIIVDGDEHLRRRSQRCSAPGGPRRARPYNGVQLPEGINVFGQSLQTRLANSVALITGSLPAQYGLRTTGVISRVSAPAQQTGGRGPQAIPPPPAHDAEGLQQAPSDGAHEAAAIKARPRNICPEAANLLDIGRGSRTT